jgi:N-methylhydantoinase B/oxoprolinase/acetone carboxylase alpha subunit
VTKQLAAGDVVRIETPGGGGFGAARRLSRYFARPS